MRRSSAQNCKQTAKSLSFFGLICYTRTCKRANLHDGGYKMNEKHSAVRRVFCLLLTLFICLAFFVSCSAKKSSAEEHDTDGTDTESNSGEAQGVIPDGVDINYVMDYMNEDLSPYVTLGAYKGLSATVESYEIDDAYIQEKIKELLDSQRTEIEVTDRMTAEGDTVIADYSGAFDGEAFSGGTAEGAEIVLSEDSGYITGFASGMIGHMPGETFDMEVTFPDEYSNQPAYSGKTAVFTVTVQCIIELSDAPKLDNTFVEEHYGDVGCHTVDEFMTYYKGYLEETRINTEKHDAISDIWSQIMEGATVKELPQKSVDAVYWSYRSAYEGYASSYGVSYETFLSQHLGYTDDDIREYAESYIKEDIVIYQIVKAEGIEVTEAEYKAGVEDFCKEYEMTEDELVETYGEDKITSVLQWNKLQDCIYEWSEITVNRT